MKTGKIIIVSLLVLLSLVLISVLSSVLFIKLLNIESAPDFQVVKHAIIIGFVFFIVIFSLLLGVVKFIEVYFEKRKMEIEKNHDIYLGQSELMRFLYNELKRYDGNEKFFLSKEENILLLLSEISDLYKVARIEHKRKSRTAPYGITPEINLDIDNFIEEQKKKLLNNKKLLSDNKKNNNNEGENYVRL